ncbi:MAG: lipid A deacylase LpxR family protein [Desulfobulbaceae bacterium]|uniref:Lipid A deacylase LpxR family protein n=1 Tax=Candidatus Desulfobia pelagia TaxID=2841692 RepID=A0A8J6NA36_9BACT|nr:lipid A deacylase LpxR family protein [Candidatus Desulfobia pelagia]
MSALFSKKLNGYTAIAILILLSAYTISYAETVTGEDPEPTAKEKNPGQYKTFLIYFENDLFANTDQYYTNAAKLTWMTKDVREYSDVLPQWLMPATRLAPSVTASSAVTPPLYTVAFTIGQDIYTPDNIESYTLIENERPYAGWLYGGLALHRKTPSHLDTFELTLGIVGPSALGEESQNTVHRYRDLDEANGWDHALNDEPGFLLSWQRHDRMLSVEKTNGFCVDLIPHYGITLGNVLTTVNTGAETRIGYRIPKDFGTSLIRPGSILSDPYSGAEDANTRFLGFHFFFGVDGRAVARNIFLDGNTWEDSHSVDKKTFVMDAYGGMALHYQCIKLTYTHVWRSKEFTGQDKPQLFGSLSLRYTF